MIYLERSLDIREGVTRRFSSTFIRQTRHDQMVSQAKASVFLNNVEMWLYVEFIQK